jgi:hypothetical protein
MTQTLTIKVGRTPRRALNHARPLPWRVYRCNGMGGRWPVRYFSTQAEAQAHAATLRAQG